jgi:hypothetical protein
MPSIHSRIAVTEDPELAAALERARTLRPGVPTARLVRDLAIRGTAAIEEDHRGSEEAIERFIERSTAADPGFDRRVALDIDRLAWSRDG